MKLLKKSIILLAFAISAVTFTSCSSKSPSTDVKTTSDVKATSDTPDSTTPVLVKVGIVGENNEQWKVIGEKLEKENIKLELVKFGDYILPNQALAEGEIDLNAFQHQSFLNNEVESKGYDILSIGNTIIAPLGLYSEKLTSVSEIKSGDKIVIPSDPVNGGRALKLLESAELITLNPEKGFAPSVTDITNNPTNLEFIEVEAAQIPNLLPDVAIAVINGGHAVDVGLNPENDSIFLEKATTGSDNPFINVIVARTADKDNEVYKKVVDAYHTDEVKKVIETSYKGAYLIGW